jgi:porin
VRRPHAKPRPDQLSDETRTPDDRSKPWWSWERATGDWGGARPWLHEHGLIPAIDYTVQLFSNVHGGRERGTRVLGNLDVSLTADGERLGLWRGATAYAAFQYQVGDGVTAQVGSAQPIGSLAAGDYATLNAWYVQQELLDGRASVQVGRSDASQDFMDSPLTGFYLNGGISPANNVPMPQYPQNAFGAVVHLDPWPQLDLAAGAWGARFSERGFRADGLFDGDVFAIGELTWSHAPWGLAGRFHAGAWLSTQDTPEVTDRPQPRSFERNWGLYALLEQLLLRRASGSAEDAGLHAWFQVSWAPPDRNANPLWVGGGLVLDRPLPGRDADSLGFAVTSAGLELVDGRRKSRAEVTLEWFYDLELNAFLSLTPDVQLVLDPGGGGRDALVLGFQWEVQF